jgi:integrase
VAHVQRRAGKWVARYVGPDGTEHSKSFRRKIDSEHYLASVEAGKLRGEWVDPKLGRVTVADAAADWLDAARPTLKPKTVAGYESLIRSRISPELGSYQLSTLKPSDVQDWIGRMQAAGLSPSRVRHGHVVLRQVLERAVMDGRVGRNAAERSRLPRIQRREAAFLEPQLVERIATEMRPPYDLFVRILGQLGPRFGEAAALRRGSIDLLRRRMLIAESLAEVNGLHIFGPTKTHTTRRVPLTSSLAAAVEEHLEEIPADPAALVFTSPQGAILRHSTFRSRYWLPALERSGLPPTGIHVLRHSAAAAMIQSGATPKTVQTVLGHASAAFTLTVYGHIFDADLDDLAARLEILGRDGDGMAVEPLSRIQERQVR